MDSEIYVRGSIVDSWIERAGRRLDDARVVHESTQIQPVAQAGYRDTLVLTYRAGGFQGD